MILTYGTGELWTQQGILDGDKCLVITKADKPHPINAHPKQWNPETKVEDCACILVFRNIESARTVQDELNELIARWSREIAPVVESYP